MDQSLAGHVQRCMQLAVAFNPLMLALLLEGISLCDVLNGYLVLALQLPAVNAQVTLLLPLLRYVAAACLPFTCACPNLTTSCLGTDFCWVAMLDRPCCRHSLWMMT